MLNTVLNLKQRMEKNDLNFEKKCFLVKVVNRSYYVKIVSTRVLKRVLSSSTWDKGVGGIYTFSVQLRHV